MQRHEPRLCARRQIVRGGEPARLGYKKIIGVFKAWMGAVLNLNKKRERESRGVWAKDIRTLGGQEAKIRFGEIMKTPGF